MLKRVENIAELDFLPADPFCARITALANTYGFNYDFAKFFVQDSNAAISSLDGNINLYANENADFEEIKAFLGFAGFATVQSSEENIKKLGYEPADSSYICLYNGAEVVKPDNFTDNYDYKEIYKLLADAGFPMGDYNSFLSDIAARVNKGNAAFGGIATDRLESCAFRLFEGNKSVLLGAIVTNPFCKGKGLARALVPYMAQTDKKAYVFCRNDSLLGFYEKLGFSFYGRWAVINNEPIQYFK